MKTTVDDHVYTDFDVRLTRYVIPSSELPQPLSPGWIPATRLSCSSPDTFYAASGTSLYRLGLTASSKQHHIPSPNCRKDDDPQAIANDFVVPRRPGSLGIDVECVAEHSVHREEIQAVCSSIDGRVATVDGYGAAVISGGVGGSFVVQPPTYESGESGWAGVAFGHTGETAIARYFYKDVNIFDGDIPKRAFNCHAYPTGVCALSEKGGMMITEGNELVVYDPRVGERYGCCARNSPGRGQLYALDARPDGDVVGTAGADRMVHVYDTKMWRVRGRWSSCLKYECVGLAMSNERRGYAYVCGIDNEVVCGAWDSDVAGELRPSIISKMISGAHTTTKRRAFGFRADSRVLGITHQFQAMEENVAVLSENAAFYSMSVSSKSTPGDRQTNTTTQINRVIA